MSLIRISSVRSKEVTTCKANANEVPSEILATEVAGIKVDEVM
jgi:hypothetical protein